MVGATKRRRARTLVGVCLPALGLGLGLGLGMASGRTQSPSGQVVDAAAAEVSATASELATAGEARERQPAVAGETPEREPAATGEIPDGAAQDGETPLPDAAQIAQRAEDVLRSDHTYFEARMTVVSPRLSAPRVVRFRSWDDRRGDRSFIRILAPAKDAGSGFLKLPPNLWSYLPRVERVIRIPPSMMLQPWMGSDFTNDDLVNESSDVDDYDHRLLRIDDAFPKAEDEVAPSGARRAYVVEYVPHADTPVVWGRIVGWIEARHYTPLRQEFYDEADALVRTLLFGDIREVDGRHVPHLWKVKAHEKPGHSTTIEIESIRFDALIEDVVFTTQNLKRRE